jgi:protoheme IX farnesyltransferase
MKLEPSVSDLSPTLSGGAAALNDSIDESPAIVADDVVSRIRARIADFTELAKLRLNFLVLVTTMVGYAMAKPDWSDWRLLLHTLLGTALTAASASILNQYVERPYDALMHRTRRRPLPAGRVAPLQALAIGVVTGILGLCELFFFVNDLTAAIGAITLASYVLLYTPLKRVTTLNTIVGAIPGALPPVMGVVAAAGSHPSADVPMILGVPLIAWALFGILFFWQMPHFLAIAILYREDYARAGFKMLPVVDPSLNMTSLQMVFYALALIPVTLAPTLLHATGAIYFFAALLLGLVFFGFALLCVVTRRRGDARQVFLASILYLPALLGVMMLDKI